MLFTHFSFAHKAALCSSCKIQFWLCSYYTQIVAGSFDCRFLCRILRKSCSWALHRKWADTGEILIHLNSRIAEKVPCDSY